MVQPLAGQCPGMLLTPVFFGIFQAWVNPDIPLTPLFLGISKPYFLKTLCLSGYMLEQTQFLDAYKPHIISGYN